MGEDEICDIDDSNLETIAVSGIDFKIESENYVHQDKPTFIIGSG